MLRRPLMNPQPEAAETPASATVDLVGFIGEAVPDFLWMADGDGTPLYQNRAWREYTGLSPAEFAASGWRSLAHPDDAALIEEVWASALSEKRSFECEHRCRRHDGAYRWFLALAVPILDASGRLARWVGTHTDIHDRKLAEAELAQAVRRKDEFLATIAHELRNPLQAIQQALYVLRLPVVDETTKNRMHDVIGRQVAQLTRFTEDFVDFNKVRWNAMSIVTKSITLGAVVDAAVESARPIIDKQQQELEVTVTDESCVLTLDPIRATQAITNLLNNASKFSPSGSSIAFFARCEHGMAVFTIRDWGCGIAADVLPKIFEFLSRAERAHGSAPEGFGIGLALARHITRLHGGTLEVQSAGEGCGSEFTIRIPLVAQPSA
ncbi:MAG: PAS domain-containing sensor histidine kinase [Gemmatimonadaceae bacterium]